MQFVDITIGAGYAAVVIILISLLSPGLAPGATDSALQRDQLQATDALNAYIGHVGWLFLDGAPASTLCASLQASSTSSVVLESSQCPAPVPSPLLVASSMTFNLPDRSLTLTAMIQG